MTDNLETVEIATSDRPEAAIIWLHGLGADGNDFAPIVPELGLENARFVFPHAPIRPVTLNNGMSMRAWFDIRDLSHDSAPDKDGIEQSAAAVTRLIRRENERGIDTRRIVLAGFSQGGASGLYTALPYPERFAGIIGLSTWLPIRNLQSPANQDTPVFLAHGEFDPVVNVAAGTATRDLLVAAGHDVEWHTYPMAHAVCPQEIRDIATFLRRVL